MRGLNSPGCCLPLYSRDKSMYTPMMRCTRLTHFLHGVIWKVKYILLVSCCLRGCHLPITLCSSFSFGTQTAFKKKILFTWCIDSWRVFLIYCRGPYLVLFSKYKFPDMLRYAVMGGVFLPWKKKCSTFWLNSVSSCMDWNLPVEKIPPLPPNTDSLPFQDLLHQIAILISVSLLKFARPGKKKKKQLHSAVITVPVNNSICLPRYCGRADFLPVEFLTEGVHEKRREHEPPRVPCSGIALCSSLRPADVIGKLCTSLSLFCWSRLHSFM